MGRKVLALKASLAAAFVAAGGAAAAQAQAAANLDEASVQGIISSYFGPLGLEDAFNKYVKLTTEGAFDNFNKFYKADVEGATRTVFGFSALKQIPPPPGFSD